MPRKKKSTVKSRIAPVGKVRTASAQQRQKEIQLRLAKQAEGKFRGEGSKHPQAKRRHQAISGALSNPALRNEGKKKKSKKK